MSMNADSYHSPSKRDGQSGLARCPSGRAQGPGTAGRRRRRPHEGEQEVGQHSHIFKVLLYCARRGMVELIPYCIAEGVDFVVDLNTS